MAPLAPTVLQVEALGGSLQDWQVLTQQAELDLAPAELHGWFGQLKQQRRLLTRAVEELHRVPAVEGATCCSHAFIVAVGIAVDWTHNSSSSGRCSSSA